MLKNYQECPFPALRIAQLCEAILGKQRFPHQLLGDQERLWLETMPNSGYTEGIDK
jgi:hypothetical protein